MSDPEIRVKVTASTAAATAELEQMANRAQRAMDAYNAASARGLSVQKQLSAAFDGARAAGASETEAFERAVAAVNTYTTAANGAATATRHVTSTFYAAQGASGLLEGRIPIRAMERFLASSQAVSTALMAAFPVIGAIAIGEVIITAGEKLAKFASDAAALGRELGSGWLDGAIAEVTGLGKEIKQADDEMLKLASDRDRLRGQQQSQDVEQSRLQAQIETYKRLTQGLGPETAKNAAAYARAAAQAAAAGERTGDATRANQLQQRIDALEKIKQLHVQSYEALEKQITSQDEVSRVGSVGIEKMRKDQELANSQYQDALKQQLVLIQEKNNLLLKGQVAEERQDRAGVDRTKTKPDEGHKIAAQWGLDQARESLAALKQETRDLESNFTATFEQGQKQLNTSLEQERKAQAEVVRQYREKVQLAAEAAQEAQSEAQSQHAVAMAQIQAAEATGQLSRGGADHAKAAADAELYRQKLEAIDAELAQLVPHTQAYNRVLREKQQLEAQQQVSAVTDQSKTAQDMASPYIKATESINQAWLGMQNKLIFGTQFVKQQFQNMGVTMLESVARSFEQMLIKQLQYEIQSRIAHQVSNQIKLASDAQAAATGEALKRSSALKEEFINAKVAATAAFKGVMSHVPPPLNFILAPVAAAAAFTGVMAVGAFEKGGIIPNTGLALVHEGEGVMPRNLTNLLSSVANNYSNQNNMNATVNSSANFNGITDRNFREMARRHSEVIFDAAHSAVRSGSRRIR